MLGLAVGFGGAWLMRRAALPASGLYPLAVLTLCFLAYGGAAAVHASGFAAVYVAALVLGNQELPHRAATRSFAEGVAWLAQIGLFVMLGLLLSPGRITLGNVGTAIVAGLVLTLVARPLSVLVSSVVRPDADRASCRSSPGPGCAAPYRSSSPPSRSARASTAPRSSSTSSSSWSSSTRC